MQQTWDEAQKWEAKWHNNCINSYFEETKQIIYAKRMGLVAVPDEGKFPCYDMQGKSILDIGGGAYSLLLKSINFSLAVVVDPCEYPEWTLSRYRAANIDFLQMKGEQLNITDKIDEVWIYNCLQHTEDPEKVIAKAKEIAPLIRLFEWIDHGITPGHLHDLKEDKLNKWLGGKGTVEHLTYAGQFLGKAFYGVFTAK